MWSRAPAAMGECRRLARGNHGVFLGLCGGCGSTKKGLRRPPAPAPWRGHWGPTPHRTLSLRPPGVPHHSRIRRPGGACSRQGQGRQRPRVRGRFSASEARGPLPTARLRWAGGGAWLPERAFPAKEAVRLFGRAGAGRCLRALSNLRGGAGFCLPEGRAALAALGRRKGPCPLGAWVSQDP